MRRKKSQLERPRKEKKMCENSHETFHESDRSRETEIKISESLKDLSVERSVIEGAANNQLYVGP